MDIGHMREFLTLAEKLNYRAAADALFISQPTLTRHINLLEEQLGSKLLDRSSHSVRLTDSGKLAEKTFKQIVTSYDELQQDVATLELNQQSNLSLGMTYYGASAYYGYPLIEAFARKYPHIQLSTLTAQSAQIYRYLHKGVIDIGLTISSDTYGKDIERFKVATIPLYAFVRPEHPFANKKSVTLEELAEQTIILNTIPVKHKHHILDLFERHNIELPKTIYTQHIDTLVLTMAETNGVFIGTKMLSAMPHQHNLFIPIEADDFTADISLVYLKDNSNPNIPLLLDAVQDIPKPRM